jgi:tRNA 2-thiouridine synthesizing protein A
MKFSKVEEGKYVLDVRGLVCPYPVLLTKKALEVLKIGETLDVFTDNPTSCETIPESVRRIGHKVVRIDEIEQAVWKIEIKKSGAP